MNLSKSQYKIYTQRVIDYYVRNKLYGVHSLKSAMGKSAENQALQSQTLQDRAFAILELPKIALKYVAKFCSAFIPISRYRKAFRGKIFSALDLLFPNRYTLTRLKAIADFRLFGRICIPQVEFAITTTCNLKCKNCTNYIPYLSRENQRTISFSDFRTYLENLLSNAHRLESLLLLGGEPLLHKELPQMLDFALQNPKIGSVYITTNGTIYFSEALRAVFDKHKGSKKLWIWVSNYTANPRLAKRLKSYDLVAYLKANDMNYIFIDDNVWGEAQPPTYREFSRTDAENSAYFLACNTPCVSVYGDELSICPRASHFAASGVVLQTTQESLKRSDNLTGGGNHTCEIHESGFEICKKSWLKNSHLATRDSQNTCESLRLSKAISREALLAFYTHTNFSACRFCDIFNENGTCTPALQIGDD